MTTMFVMLLLKLHFIDGGKEKELLADLRDAIAKGDVSRFMISTVKSIFTTN